MPYLRNITLTIDESNLSSEQINQLKIADQLIENFNNTDSGNQVYNLFSYNGIEFSSANYGYAHRFLLDDINMTLKNNKNLHFEFLKKEFDEIIQPYLNPFMPKKINPNDQILINRILQYLDSNLKMPNPAYLQEEDFKADVRSFSIYYKQ